MAVVLAASAAVAGAGGGDAGATVPPPSITATPSTGLLYGQQVTVQGAGASPDSEVFTLECNLAPGQPTIDTEGVDLPVGCSGLFGFDEFSEPFALTSGTGTFTSTVVVLTGIVGPPTTGQDSAGRNASTDAAAYPCPPTPAQQVADVSCGVAFVPLPDDPTEAATSALVSAPITFGTPVTTSPTLSATPSTGLSSGESVTLTGAGYTPDSPFDVAECNVTPGEPPASYGGFTGIGCSGSSDDGLVLVGTSPQPVTDAGGGLSQTATVEEGNIGGSAQSAAYPCPPTPAQVTAGGYCAFEVDDAAGERVLTPALTITGPIPVPSLTVDPSTQLVAGEQVTVQASGMAPNSQGAAVECNLDPDQPTIPVDGIAAPVSCSNPFDGDLSIVSPTGTVTTSVTITTGVTGPPSDGTDSGGGDAAVDAADYPCPPTPAQQADGITCGIDWGDLSGDLASAPISFAPPPPPAPVPPAPTTSDGKGYWLVASDGGIFAYGDAGFHGSAGGTTLDKPIVGMAATPDGKGYWLVASDGGIFAYGDAGFHGSAGGTTLDKPIVGMAATPDGKGYWLVASDGGIFAYGDAGFHGSAGGTTLDKPIVGMAATPDGKGYWLVASDGGIFAYGDAGFYGSAGGTTLDKPIVGMAATPDGKGYWLVASDGGIFAYGDAGFYGSAGGTTLDKPIVGMAATPDGKGYWLVASDGGIFAYGDAGFYGSASGTTLDKPIVGMAAG